MSAFDEIKDKAAALINGNKDSIKQGIDKAGDFIDSKTNNQHADKVDQAQAKAHEIVDGLGDKPAGQ